MSFIPVMTKLNFHQSLIQSSVSHDPSEIWFGGQETFLIIINGGNICVAFENVIYFRIIW